MELGSIPVLPGLLRVLLSYLRKFLWRVLSVGPIPNHIACIMDGNRRYAKKNSLDDGEGYRAAFTALLGFCKYCSELKIKHLTLFAFSIDNFKRKPEEVKCVMDVMLEKTHFFLKEEALAKRYGIKIRFVGNLDLLSEPMRLAAQQAMEATKDNNKMIISICAAYKSSNEIVNAVQKCSKAKLKGRSRKLTLPNLRPAIKVEDLENYMAVPSFPDPCILIRTSGEKRLSDFLLWQTSNCLLYSPAALWPDIGIRHLVWAIINYQRLHPYLQK